MYSFILLLFLLLAYFFLFSIFFQTSSLFSLCRVEVSHFAFIASVVPGLFCALVLIVGYGGTPEGREMIFGPWGLLGWTQSPGLALAQVVSSILGGVSDLRNYLSRDMVLVGFF